MISTEKIGSDLRVFERCAQILGIYKCKFYCNGTRVYGDDTLFELCPSDWPVEIVVDHFDQPHKAPQMFNRYTSLFLSKLRQQFVRLKRGENNYWIVDEDNNGSNDNTIAVVESEYDSGEEDKEKEEQEE